VGILTFHLQMNCETRRTPGFKRQKPGPPALIAGKRLRAHVFAIVDDGHDVAVGREAVIEI
jgi:hypothetical protein